VTALPLETVLTYCCVSIRCSYTGFSENSHCGRGCTAIVPSPLNVEPSSSSPPTRTSTLPRRCDASLVETTAWTSQLRGFCISGPPRVSRSSSRRGLIVPVTVVFQKLRHVSWTCGWTKPTCLSPAKFHSCSKVADFLERVRNDAAIQELVAAASKQPEPFKAIGGVAAAAGFDVAADDFQAALSAELSDKALDGIAAGFRAPGEWFAEAYRSQLPLDSNPIKKG
jgi:predicted ribosomally synthesized peptide with nif11-like leader